MYARQLKGWQLGLLWGGVGAGLVAIVLTLVAGIVGVGILALAIWWTGGSYLLDPDTSRSQAAVTEMAREWARLEPLPASATDLRADMTGSPFSREVTVSFRAKSEEVAQWLQASPGTAGFKAVPGAAWSKWEVSPGGGGALYATIEVSADGTQVRIRGVWS